MDSVCDNAEQEKTLRTKKKERLADTEAHRHTHRHFTKFRPTRLKNETYSIYMALFVSLFSLALFLSSATKLLRTTFVI